MKNGALILGARGATALVAPVWALMLAVIVIPSVYVLWLSFHSSTFGLVYSRPFGMTMTCEPTV